MLRRLIPSTPTQFQRLHAALTIVWLLSVFPVLLMPGWKKSVAVLVFISIYANVAGHFSAWQAARVEVRQHKESARSERFHVVAAHDVR